MLSRTAEAVFWMARYLERAENVARMIDVNYHLGLGSHSQTAPEQWEPLIDISGDREAFVRCYESVTREHTIHFLAFDEDNPNSIVSCVNAARANARSVRDSISSETWRQVNRFYLMLGDAARSDAGPASLHKWLTDVKLASQLCDGVTNATMLHGEAWDFYWLGRNLERADKTARILDVKYFILLPAVSDVGTPFDELQWSAVLRSVDALEVYRKRHGRITPLRVTDFLLLDAQFPRSVHFCLIWAEQFLHAITGTPMGAFGNPVEQRLGLLRARLAFSDAERVLIDGLHEFLMELISGLNSVGNQLVGTFFVPEPSRLAVATEQ